MSEELFAQRLGLLDDVSIENFALCDDDFALLARSVRCIVGLIERQRRIVHDQVDFLEDGKAGYEGSTSSSGQP